MDFKNDFFAISFDKFKTFLSDYDIAVTDKIVDALCHDDFKYIKNKKGVYECKKIYSEERIKNSVNGRMKNKIKKLEIEKKNKQELIKNIEDNNINEENKISGKTEVSNIESKNKDIYNRKIHKYNNLANNEEYLNKEEIINNVNTLLIFQKEICGNIDNFIISIEKASPRKLGNIINENITTLRKETEYITKKSYFVNEKLLKILKSH